MKIISRPGIQITCPKCGAVVEYDVTDVHVNDIGHGSPPEYIGCPCCGATIKVAVPTSWLSTLYPG